jgi:hypothetical protein
MPRLTVTRREMERAYRAHKEGTSSCDQFSRDLLRVYTVECGLKAALMRQRRAATTDDFPEQTFGPDGHDIREGLKQLRVAIKMPAHATTDQKVPQSVPPNRLHVAFRYGVKLADPSATSVLGTLQEILDWLERELR